MLEGRRQADADAMLARLESLATHEDEVLVGLVAVDIGHPIFTFFFGRARHEGRAALVSLARLTPTFYGLPEDRELTVSRAAWETLHELGHVAGLVHCDDYGCLMHFSRSVEAIDVRGKEFCENCRDQLAGELAR